MFSEQLILESRHTTDFHEKVKILLGNNSVRETETVGEGGDSPIRCSWNGERREGFVPRNTVIGNEIRELRSDDK